MQPLFFITETVRQYGCVSLCGNVWMGGWIDLANAGRLGGTVQDEPNTMYGGVGPRPCATCLFFFLLA
jgi:hypothetical protein